ncbi:pentatricopeptide repeat-containing protein At5g66520-like [Cornus florida]|uniref:pentatricopeptide repeat-containing protein At5g66520-like n=1 Tax=Cornus florida TaxID=4283 RepID=UPI0028A204B9|nr:pentatricopeptide repeat-containing protein At5g66520-like [Cornus florida]
MEPKRLYLKNIIARLIDECKNMRELKQIHAQIITSPHLPKPDHFFLISRLLFFSATSKSGSLSYAEDVFKIVENPNLFVYNAMIRAHAYKMKDWDGPNSCRALILYKQMLCNGIAPDCITFPFIVKECTGRLDGVTGQSIHAHVVKFGFHNDVFIQNSMISLYSAFGFLKGARKVFDEMSNRDIVSWNSIIIGCLRGGDVDSGLDLFRKMEKRNIITWNSIITGFVQAGRSKEALELFHEMQVDDVVSPDKITIASVLSACASLGANVHGKWVHGYLKRSGLECDMVIGTALVDMYGKCGFVETAFQIFMEMPEKDVMAWTSMISVFALHGYGMEAFDLFKEMESVGVRPNPVTIVVLLSACAHSGLVEKGRWCFDLMRHYSIKPQVQHYACMVDILSRASLFDEVEGLIKTMPMEPDVFVWGALLGGCQMHGNVELGEKVAQTLIDMEPLNHAFYVTLCDIFAKAGKFDNVKKTRAFMNDKWIKKVIPGSSMIEVDGIVHEFSVRGSPEVVMEELIYVLNLLSNEIR